jgi:hypothetical protein
MFVPNCRNCGSRRGLRFFEYSEVGLHMKFKVIYILCAAVFLPLAVSARPTTALKLPTTDAQCLKSPARLGSDNLPPSSETRATTIIDITAYVNDDETPLVWVYRTYSNQLWVQANFGNTSGLQSALVPHQYQLLTRDHRSYDRAGIPTRLSSSQLLLLKNSLVRHGARLQRCFSEKYTTF